MAVTRAQVDDAARLVEPLLAWSAMHSGVPGIAYGIGHGDDTVLLGARGVADVGASTPVDAATTTFRCASITKSFTATMVLQQVERGRLRLDDLVTERLAWTRGVLDRDLTLRHLLMHAGSINRDGSNDWSDRLMPDAAALRAELRRSAAFGAPAERFRYSNLSYALLGEVLESVAGRGFSDLLRRDVAAPLGLASTVGDLTDRSRRHLATGYYATWPGEPHRAAAHVPARAIAPAGGLVSNVADLLAYQRAHLPGDPSLLRELSKREMQRTQWQRRTAPHYGLGWMNWSHGSIDVVGHSGGYPGFTTMIGFAPAHGVTCAVLTNNVARVATTGLMTVYEVLDGVSSHWDAVSAPSKHHTRRSLARFAGVYRDHFGALVVGRLNHGLCVVRPGLPFSETSLLVPVGPLRFLVASGDEFGFVGETLRFRQDRRGVVTTFRWGAHELVRTEL